MATVRGHGTAGSIIWSRSATLSAGCARKRVAGTSWASGGFGRKLGMGTWQLAGLRKAVTNPGTGTDPDGGEKGGGGGGMPASVSDIRLYFANALSWPLQDLPLTVLDATPEGGPAGAHG